MISNEMIPTKIRYTHFLTFSRCAILLPQYPPKKLPTDNTKPISQLIIPLNANINKETKLIIIKRKFLMGFAFVKSKPQARINSNNINIAESKTISPAQIPIRKKTM